MFGLELPSVTLYYYLFLRPGDLRRRHLLPARAQSRIGRAWMAIREDEIAAKAMGINTRNLKLLAFGMGATFGGVSGAMFASFQGFISPESFSLHGVGHDRRDGRARRHRPHPGRRSLGALLLAALPEVLRYVAGPLQT